jgi:hypothetical protein
MPAKYATGGKRQLPLRRHQRGGLRSIARHADESRKHCLRHYNVIEAATSGSGKASLAKPADRLLDGSPASGGEIH